MARTLYAPTTPPPATRSLAGALRVAAALLVLLGLDAGVAPAGPDLFDEIHARVRVAEAKRQTIRARFTETTTSSLLVKPMVARGTLLGAKPARLLMQYTSPERKTILMDGNRLVIARPDRGESERIDITEIMKRVNHYFVDADPGQLRRSFTIRAFIDPDMGGSYRLDLVPKRKQIKQGVERLQIWIARDPLLLSQIRITFPGGDDTTFRIDDAELNVPLPARAFDLDIPPARRK